MGTMVVLLFKKHQGKIYSGFSGKAPGGGFFFGLFEASKIKTPPPGAFRKFQAFDFVSTA